MLNYLTMLNIFSPYVFHTMPISLNIHYYAPYTIDGRHTGPSASSKQKSKPDVEKYMRSSRGLVLIMSHYASLCCNTKSFKILNCK